MKKMERKILKVKDALIYPWNKLIFMNLRIKEGKNFQKD